MESVPDYYTILGIAANASSDEIRRAYRRLARMYHPDRNGGSPVYVERMKALNAARDLLSDPAQRAVYDARRASASRTRDVPGHSSGASHPGSAWVYEDQESTIRARERRRQARDDAWREAAWREAVWQASAAASGARRRPGPISDEQLRAMMAAEFGRPNPVASWMGCLAVLLGILVVFAFGLGGILGSRSTPNSFDRPAAIINPAPGTTNSSDEPHLDLCQAILLNPSVMSAATGADGVTIIVTMIPDTTLSDRISAAWKIDATMDSRLHQGIDDHLTSIRVVPSSAPGLLQDSSVPIILLPGRQSWGIQMPDQR